MEARIQQQRLQHQRRLAFIAAVLALVVIFSFLSIASLLKEIKLSDEELKQQNQANYKKFPRNNDTTALFGGNSYGDNNEATTDKPLSFQISTGEISNTISATQINRAILQRNQDFLKAKQANALPSSPACYPHFNHYQPNGQWNNTTKFKRILFYHARKAGGTSLTNYLVKVAQTYGIKIEWIEWTAMEEPGASSNQEDTFYVTHLREPIDRSISHFKFQGRWSCPKLMRDDFVPTEENANKLETWDKTGGHTRKRSCVNNGTLFRLRDCSVNCYTQWFGGLNCPRWKVPMEQQYEVAMSKLLKYNLVIVIEKLRDPKYVQAIEDFFGVQGILERGAPPCEVESHKANEENPLIVRNETRQKLTDLNRLDLKLYHEISDCLEGGNYGHIPKWDESRFVLHPSNFAQAKRKTRFKTTKAMSNQRREHT